MGPDNRKYEFNEEQNPSKLTILIKKTTFDRETTILQIIWNTISPASSFLSFVKRTDRLRSKDMTIVNKRS